MINRNEHEILAILERRLSEHRFQHSVAVAQAARELAAIFGEEEDLAYKTGLLHDYAKGIPAPQLIAIASENGLIEDEIENKVPDLLHAPVGAYLLKLELGIENPTVLEAVRVHTMGSLHMSRLDKIIFLADMIEPGRDYPGQDRLDCLARRDLDRAMLYGLDATIRYCLDQARILHPRTITVRNHFLEILRQPIKDE
ncbi:MAG TPA: bis(5'-nucleosyl)-tetraphosphatase (symmetrical) YqeK [Syntrophomonas sp.]|nr:bis(5'-nucleosyl)-tetraphosphatase (symmetrical) YqeK [Syntrophomonas sp.]HRW12180.1 bis(5'-nucleosyl)-tetraphosphatase (symmetrical) YqeK [Syntrophomonas sp.]